MTPGPRDVPGPEFDEPNPDPVNASETPTVDAASPEGVKAQTKRVAQRQRNAAEFWGEIFATEEGRREMYAIIAAGGLFETRSGVSANGSHDPVLTAFHQGQHAHMQELFLKWLGYDREGVLAMLAENNGKVKEAEAAAKIRRPTRNPRKPRPQ